MTARFLQIHTLTSYPASLLNRDDAGFAKRMPFGGATRTRISSQCLKRHWRVFDGEYGLRSVEAPESIRSRESFERHVVQPLLDEGFDERVVRAAVWKLVGKVFGGEDKKEKAERSGGRKSVKGGKGEDSGAAAEATIKTAQVTVVGMPELHYLRTLARRAVEEAGADASRAEAGIDSRMKDDKQLKENLRALAPGSLEAGLGAALFGRMVTGDYLSRTDAAIHVAHSLTVHGQMTESDYFSAIDDLTREDGDQASGHINASELTSGVFYGYVVVDVPGLVSNLGGDRELASEVVRRLVRMVATVSPGAKRGSTAPYAYSHLVLAESGRAQPRTLQNAFVEPVKPAGHLLESANRAMAKHLADLDEMYGKTESRAHAGLGTGELFERRMPLPSLADWVAEQVLM